MIDSSLRFYVRVAKSGVSRGGVLCGWPCVIVHHLVIIMTYSEMLQNTEKRKFHQLRLSSLLQRFSSGVLRRLL